MGCLTVAISGTSGAGKSTLIAGVAAALAPVAVLRFDDYESVARYPPDMRVWIDEGGDCDAFETPQFDADVAALRAGRAITLPSGLIVEPAPLVLLEEPFGRQRTGMRSQIDLVVLLDTPSDVALARKVLRMIDFFEAERGTDALLRHMRFFLPWYIACGRELYTTVNEGISLDCDFVLDGKLPGEELIAQMVGWLRGHITQRL